MSSSLALSVNTLTHHPPSSFFFPSFPHLGGSLASLLRDRSKPYDMFGIAIDVAEGMDYLHKRGVMHRDLKSDNLLLNKENRAVIADFGLVCPTITVSDHTGR